MFDFDKFILRGKNRLYKVYCDKCNLSVAFRPKSSKIKHECRSCSSKSRIEKYGNPMQNKVHSNKDKFRKESHKNIDYDDRLVTVNKSGNKRIKYRKKCPICNNDMGYHINSDAKRKCLKCQGDINRKTTKMQRNIRSSMKANIGIRLRCRKGSKEGISTFSMLDYSLQDLMNYLESKFVEGMSWANYGRNGWHIDHVIPDSWFEYESYGDNGFKQSWALQNLQPMWAKDNLRKSNKFKG